MPGPSPPCPPRRHALCAETGRTGRAAPRPPLLRRESNARRGTVAEQRSRVEPVVDRAPRAPDVGSVLTGAVGADEAPALQRIRQRALDRPAREPHDAALALSSSSSVGVYRARYHSLEKLMVPSSAVACASESAVCATSSKRLTSSSSPSRMPQRGRRASTTMVGSVNGSVSTRSTSERVAPAVSSKAGEIQACHRSDARRSDTAPCSGRGEHIPARGAGGPPRQIPPRAVQQHHERTRHRRLGG